MDTEIEALERRIDRIKQELIGLGELRPGSLSRQYNVCGTPGCRCKADPPKKHGPYYQLGWTRKGRSTTRFVKRGTVGDVRRQIKNYDKLQKLVANWVDLSIELCELKKKQEACG